MDYGKASASLLCTAELRQLEGAQAWTTTMCGRVCVREVVCVGGFAGKRQASKQAMMDDG